ncbi:MAG: Crp/Fnr family transcriptional regulator [Hyphomicrobiales bacterium]
MRVKSDVELLRQIPLFGDVEDAHLQVLSFSTKRKKIASGRYVFKEGGKGAAAYLIIEGRVEILTGEKGSRKKITEADEGDFLGETAMVAGVPYSVSAKAETKTTVLEISRKIFFDVAQEFPGFAGHVMKAMNERLEENLDDLKKVQDLLETAGSWETMTDRS